MTNGVTVASLETHSPVSRVSVLYPAGSRHESPDNLGIMHGLRAAFNLVSCATAFRFSTFCLSRRINLLAVN